MFSFCIINCILVKYVECSIQPFRLYGTGAKNGFTLGEAPIVHTIALFIDKFNSKHVAMYHWVADEWKGMHVIARLIAITMAQCSSGVRGWSEIKVEKRFSFLWCIWLDWIEDADVFRCRSVFKKKNSRFLVSQPCSNLFLYESFRNRPSTMVNWFLTDSRQFT